VTTRFYFRDATPAVTPSSWSAGWNKTSATLYSLITNKILGTGGATLSNTASGTSGHFTGIYRAVSLPLLAQTISGTIKGQFQCSETNATDNYTLAVAIKIIQADGTDRAVLLAASASDDTSATPPEMVVTTQTNRRFQDSSENFSITLSSQAVTAGDRLVIEIGYRQASTSVANGGVRTASTDASDLPEDSTTTTNANPWLEFSGNILLAPYYYGSASTPADNGTGTADPTDVTPPTGMVAGDLVCMVGVQRATGAALAISNNGGQSWTSEAAIGITNCTVRLFWCVFDGTWDANPSVDFDATTNNSVQMHVWRPPSASYTWSANQALAETEDATSPYANPGQTTTGTDPTLTLVGWFTADDNSWDASGDTGWLLAGTAQYRNTSGNDTSASYEYKVQLTGGATGSVDKLQNTVTGDACTTLAISWACAAPVAQAPFAPLFQHKPISLRI
jgi:hypothetical protein